MKNPGHQDRLATLDGLAAGGGQEVVEPAAMAANVTQAVTEIGKVVLGKEPQVRLALCCLFSGGHLLLEDKPGMGKTTLSQALARVFGLAFSRIQFTSDLLPADILGVSIYDQRESRFVFHEGPVFSNLVLADEINRTTPKTQSALLEAMEEGQVTVDGQTRVLASPFFVIATQNPLNFAGTYPLPESQLDRFLMRLRLGYPDPVAERQLLLSHDQRQRLDTIQQCLSPADVARWNRAIAGVEASASLLDYVQRLVAFTRRENEFSVGLSPRGAQALMRAARTWTLMDGRLHVLPEDVQAVLPAVVDHRLRGSGDARSSQSERHARRLLEQVDVFPS